MEGNGKQRRRHERSTHPKGRQVDPAALAELRDLLGERPRRRDLLIEYLHAIQDRWHGLHARHVAALAHELRLAQAEVYEVASFYAHFDLLGDGAAEPATLTIRVCDGLPCTLAGADRLLEEARSWLESGAHPDWRVVTAPCMGLCDRAPAACVGRRAVAPARVAEIAAAAAAGETSEPAPAGAVDLDGYRRAGGYALLDDCRRGVRTREAVFAALDDSGLRGLGGAGFPAGRKWRAVAAQPAPRLVVVNADEGEPGTFKDRHFLESDPHRVIEGMLIAAWAVDAAAAFIYLRDEYPGLHRLLAAELEKLKSTGIAGKLEIELRRGAGAYVCGEESAMLESIEGKRGLPRHKPPYPAEVGLFGRPTLVHNVETLAWLRDIVVCGPGWYTAHGRNGRRGLRAFSVSGRVKEPGIKIAPAGISARELIQEYCGGMAPGHRLAAYLPGGASGGILPASLADLPLDFGTLDRHGAFVGSAAVIVLSDRDDVRAAARNLMRFFADESCGQCTPCRVGTEKALALMQAPVWDEAMLSDLAAVMQDASICGLGQAAPNPVLSVLRHFGGDAKGREP